MINFVIEGGGGGLGWALILAIIWNMFSNLPFEN